MSGSVRGAVSNGRPYRKANQSKNVKLCLSGSRMACVVSATGLDYPFQHELKTRPPVPRPSPPEPLFHVPLPTSKASQKTGKQPFGRDLRTFSGCSLLLRRTPAQASELCCDHCHYIASTQ